MRVTLKAQKGGSTFGTREYELELMPIGWARHFWRPFAHSGVYGGRQAVTKEALGFRWHTWTAIEALSGARENAVTDESAADKEKEAREQLHHRAIADDQRAHEALCTAIGAVLGAACVAMWGLTGGVGYVATSVGWCIYQHRVAKKAWDAHWRSYWREPEAAA